MTLALVLSLALVSGLQPSPAPARVIEALLGWAVEGRGLPHRSCGGLLDPEHLPTTIYVAWDLSAEAQALSNAQATGASEASSGIRQDRVDSIRQAIANGTYESPEKLSGALDRLLDSFA